MDTDDRSPPRGVTPDAVTPDAATPDGLRPAASADAERLLAALQAEPFRFGFYNALRLLDSLNPELPRLGHAERPRDEAVRIGQEPTMAFAGSTLAHFGPAPESRAAEGSPAWVLRTYFLGLFGPNGPLPLHLTEYVYERLRGSRDPTLARFADLFHHRFASLFYRAWAAAQPTVQFDRPAEDRFGDYVGSLFGLGFPSLLDRDAMPDRVKRHFAGHLSCQTRHVDGLRAMLETFFRAKVRIEEFVGHWLALPPECRCVLGRSPDTGTLGRSVTIGDRVWDRQLKFCIELGPLTFAAYGRLLPGGASLARLVAIVRNYVGDEWFWDLRLVLRKEEVPATRLGQSGQLGWTTWLAQRERRDDARDLVFAP